MPAASPLMWLKAAARSARAKALCAWSSFSCPACMPPARSASGARYNAKTLEIKYRDKNIAEVLRMTVNEAAEFFEEEAAISRALTTLREVGLGYIRLGQPATELSGGEAQRIKLATELQRAGRGNTLYILDEPTTGLHPSDVERLLAQLEGLVDGGQYGDCGGARYARGGRLRLGDRHWPRRGR